MLDQLTYKPENREKGAFYASDVGKPLLDLYFAFRGIERTNPPHWWDTLKWGAGRGVEDAILQIFKDSGIVPEDYNQKEHGRISIEREGITINGYIDAKTKDGMPIEVKSINNANKFDVKKYEDNKPRENYVGQLAVYMDALGVDRGGLFVSSIDGLHRFWFDCVKTGERKYKCGETEIDLDAVYKSWAKLYHENVVPNNPPDIFEYMYKIPVDKIEWRAVSVGDISKARNNAKVIGDFQVQYSNWKDLIVKLQGETLGYTPDEIEYIKTETKGFSSKTKKL